MKAFSDISSTFVSSLFPRKGESIKLSFVSDEGLDYALVSSDSDTGLSWHYNMTEQKLDEFVLYSGTVKIPYDDSPFYYYFILVKNGEVFYLSKRGLTRYVPAVLSRFSILKDYAAPTWVASSTCYQIFPDRFRKGDLSVGAKKGDYEYDGAEITTPSFYDVPEEFSQSRCLDFYNGDLKGIEESIPYFKKLGIDALYINPINASMTVHRFDATDYFHIDEKLGGDKAYLSLVKACHENEIKLIVDISINHTSYEHKWFKKALNNPDSEEKEFYYFDENGDALCWQGVKTLCQLNYQNKKLRTLIYKGKNSALKKFLMPPYFQDGWRLDVAPEVGRLGKIQLTHEIWKEVRKELKEVREDVYLVGEDWDDSYQYLQGDEWDGTMNYYGSGRIIRSFLGEEDRFLTGAWGHSPRKVKPLDAYETADALNEALNNTTGQIIYFQMNLFDSHDTPRLHNNMEVYDKDLYFGVNLLLYMLPGMPNTYYGDEIGLKGRMGSVEGARYPMEWRMEYQDKETLSWFIELGAARKRKFLAYSSTIIRALDEETLCIVRFTLDEAYLAVINKSDRNKGVCVNLPFVKKGKIERILGEGDVSNTGSTFKISLKRHKSVLFYIK